MNQRFLPQVKIAIALECQFGTHQVFRVENGLSTTFLLDAG